MPKRLTDNVNSRYFEAANHMRPKGKKNKIIAYVESYDDIFFWRDVLSEFETDELGFEIALPSRTSLTRGKKSAMMNQLGKGLGTSMIACVDADYDYLMQGHTPSSRIFMDNPFVVHTYVYAIENFQCYAESLHNVCVMATLNDEEIFDFVAYLKTYSQIIYNLFVWSMWIYRNGLAQQFPLQAFCSVTSTNYIKINKPEEALEIIQGNVNKKIAWLQRTFPEAKGKLKPLEEELNELGLTHDNTYLYMQGHHLMDDVVMKLLVPVCDILRNSREKEIKQFTNVHPIQVENELASYEHSQASIEQMLRRNTEYKKAPQFQQVRAKIQEILKKLDD